MLYTDDQIEDIRREILYYLDSSRSIYIAGSSKEIPRALHWTTEAKRVGLYVTSNWIQNIKRVAEERTGGDIVAAANPISASHADQLQWSLDNIHAIRKSKQLWLLIPNRATPSQGAFFEFGIAYERNIHTIASGGDPSAVNTALATRRFETDEQAFAMICRQFMSNDLARKIGWQGIHGEIPPWIIDLDDNSHV